MKLFGSSGGKWTDKEEQNSAASDLQIDDDWDIEELLAGTKQAPKQEANPAPAAPVRPAGLPLQREQAPAQQPQRPAYTAARQPLGQPQPTERPLSPEPPYAAEGSRRTEQPIPVKRPQRAAHTAEERPQANYTPGRENAWGKGVLLVTASLLVLLLSIYAVGAELTLWI